jgi:hypothetical protein
MDIWKTKSLLADLERLLEEIEREKERTGDILSRSKLMQWEIDLSRAIKSVRTSSEKQKEGAYANS